MISVTQRVHDLAVSHRIGLSRYSNTVVRNVLALLRRTETDVISRLQQTDLTGAGRQRVEELLVAIRSIQREGWARIDTAFMARLTELTAVEVAFAERVLSVTGKTPALAAMFSGAPAVDQVVAAVKSRPFQGRLLRDWLSEAEEGAAKRVRETIRQGVVEGTPTQDIVRQLRGTKAANYKNGVMTMSARGAEAMVRTAITHTSNTAANETYRRFGVTHLIWTSTLDSRTSHKCQALSEKVFEIGKGPRPPAHINCRSVMRPQVPEIAGVTPYKPKSYNEWLKGQPADVQDDILGKSRGKLFRDGGYSVDRFVDRDGELITLDQLRNRDASAFERAGL